MVAEVGAFVVFAYLLWGINKWIAMFAVVVCLSSLFPQYDKATFLAAHAVFYGLLWYYVIYKRGDVDLILNAMCIIALFNVLFLVAQYFNINTIIKSIETGDPINVGLMGNRNEVSAVLAFCFPAFLRKKWCWLIPVLALGLILSESSGGILAVLVGGFYYSWNKFNKKVVVCVFLGLLSAALFIKLPTFRLRYETWIIAAKLYTEHFFFGSGIGHWKYVFKDIVIIESKLRMHTAHNEYIQGIFEMGVPFIIILCGFLYTLIKRLKNDIFKVAGIVILINCFVNFPLHIAVTAYMVLTWLALIDQSGDIRSSHKGELK